ncbi:MAG: hypothetical protein ABI645_05180 [Pseudomonadota bacterium]
MRAYAFCVLSGEHPGERQHAGLGQRAIQRDNTEGRIAVQEGRHLQVRKAAHVQTAPWQTVQGWWR